jgi:hypothetical protein
MAHSEALAGLFYGAWECVRMIRCDSFSEIPGAPSERADGEDCEAT